MSKPVLKKWKQPNQNIITDRWIRLRADSCLTPAGDVIEPWYVLEYPDWVSCVMLSEDLKK